MSELIEKLARMYCALDDADPDSSLGGDGQNFLWMEYAETHVKPMLAEIFDWLAEPSESMIEIGTECSTEPSYSGSLLATRDAWKAMLEQACKEAGV